jgi:hypothetical protein
LAHHINCSPWVKVLEDPRGPGELARARDAGEKDAGMAVEVDVLDEEDRKIVTLIEESRSQGYCRISRGTYCQAVAER